MIGMMLCKAAGQSSGRVRCRILLVSVTMANYYTWDRVMGGSAYHPKLVAPDISGNIGDTIGNPIPYRMLCFSRVRFRSLTVPQTTWEAEIADLRWSKWRVGLVLCGCVLVLVWPSDSRITVKNNCALKIHTSILHIMETSRT